MIYRKRCWGVGNYGASLPLVIRENLGDAAQEYFEAAHAEEYGYNGVPIPSNWRENPKKALSKYAKLNPSAAPVVVWVEWGGFA